MKFEYLREFVVAARADEMQLGAKELGLSPSVLSKHIKTLELELGVPLFMRSRNSELSPYGSIMLSYAEELVKLQDDYLNSFSEQSGEIATKLTVGCSPVQFRERTGLFIEQFMQKHPYELKVSEAKNALLCEMVVSGELDMAFIRTQPELKRDPELVYFPFCSDPMVAFFPMDHPLAKAPCVSFENLKDETVVLRSPNSSVTKVYTEKCRECGFEPKLSFNTSTYACYDLVRRGEAITLYLASPAEAHRKLLQIAYVPIHPPIISYIDIVFRPRDLPPLGVELLREVQRTVAEWYHGSDSGAD